MDPNIYQTLKASDSIAIEKSDGGPVAVRKSFDPYTGAPLPDVRETLDLDQMVMQRDGLAAAIAASQTGLDQMNVLIADCMTAMSG